jgi:hypothetical protein
MATATAPDTFTHITVPNADGNGPTDRWHATETYKVPQSVADDLAKMQDKPTGHDLANWLRDQGGVLDDDHGKPARVSKRNDGTVMNDHYTNGTYIKGNVVEPPAVAAKHKADTEAGVTLFMTLITGGAYPLMKAAADVKAAGEHPEGGSRFASPTTASAATTGDAPVAAKSRPGAKPPKPQ